MAHVTGRRETRSTRKLLDDALAYDPRYSDTARIADIAKACRRLNVISMRELITVALERGQQPTLWEADVLMDGYNRYRYESGHLAFNPLHFDG
jgi:hypothetical protein